MMFFSKRIVGKIESYKSCKEQYLPNPSENTDLNDVTDGFSADYISRRYRYYVAYEDLCISYTYMGEKKKTVYSKLILENMLSVGDPIILDYNRRKKEFSIRL